MSDTSDQGEVSLSISTFDAGKAMDKAAETTQLDERRIATDIGRGIKPPYSPTTLASFSELNETHAACLRKKSRYEVGYGFDIVPHPSADDPDPDGEQHQAVEGFWHGTDSRWQTGPEGTAAATPEEVLELARQDYHSIGWAALEVLVEGDGTPMGLAHVPATTVRVRKTETDDGEVLRGHGYVQVRGGQTRFFGEAGDRYGDDPTFVDKETGDVADDASALENGPANELIFVPNPSPLSLYYGIPDWVSAMQTMAADQAAKEFNHDIFENLGVPHYAVKVTGGTLTEESKDELRELVNNLKGSNYRTAVLEVEEFEQQNALSTEDGNDVDIEFIPIGANEDRDMEFESFRARNEHDIAKVHSVPPILINVTETSNRSSSKEQVREFAEDVIAPEQSKFESRLYHIIHMKALEAPEWTIDFTLRGADRPERDARVTRQRVDAAGEAVTINEAREAAGWGALPEDHPADGDDLLADTSADGGDDETWESGLPAEAQLPPSANKIGERDWGGVESELATKEIEQTSFASSNLDEGLYSYDDQELYLSFKREDGSNSLYVYVDVPPTVWAALVNASSHGSYHYSSIRLEYSYLEVTGFHSRLPEGPSPPTGDDAPDDIPSGI